MRRRRAIEDAPRRRGVVREIGLRGEQTQRFGEHRQVEAHGCKPAEQNPKQQAVSIQ
jgi:hypothetical protein